MGAILGGAGAALAWAMASTVASRSARALGPWVALSWVLFFGLLILLPVIALSPAPDLSGSTGPLLLLSGVANVGGLLMTYRALELGPVGVVAPIVGAEGGVTAVISVLAGQELAALQGLALAGVLVGVTMVGWRAREPAAPGDAAVVLEAGADDAGDLRRAAVWATLAAVTFGVGLYATGAAGDEVSAGWAVLPSRVVGVLVLTVPLALRGALRLPRAVVPFVVAGGCCEVVGFLCFTAGASTDIAVTAVLASLTGAVAAGFGRLFYDERLTARQLAGVGLLVVAVGALGALT